MLSHLRLVIEAVWKGKKAFAGPWFEYKQQLHSRNDAGIE